MNQMIRAPQMGMQQGNWVWDGQRWVCCPDDGTCPPIDQPPFCPPVGFPPHGCPPWFPPPQGQPPWYPGANAGVTFSQTAPVNVVRGHFWWNGTVLQMWDGAAWVAIGPGASPGPGPGPGPVTTTTAVFAISSPIDIPGLNTAPLDWGIVPITTTPLIDLNQGWDPITKQYKPNKAGFYQFFTTQFIVTPTSNAGHTVIRNDMGSLPNLSNADVVSVIAIGDVAGEYLTGTGIAFLNGTTDFVRLWAYAGDGIYRVISSSVPIMRAYLLP